MGGNREQGKEERKGKYGKGRVMIGQAENFVFYYFILVNHWQNKHNRRLFFEHYAEKNGFDPLIPDNWYTVPYSDIVAFKVSIYISFHSDNLLTPTN
jgi:hypothetical protein